MDLSNGNLVEELNDLWHSLIFTFQSKDSLLWGEELENATTIELSILDIVERRPQVLLKEIKGILNIPGSTLTNAIDRLEKRRLLARVISPRDRRSFGLELTDRGKKAQKTHIRVERMLCEKILGALNSQEEQREFIASLKKIYKAFAD